ncbi:hypothetical protein GUJ93_ZPchr0012g19642 [Zizania palustris]|uniref:Uncharacterized protein n=1 Tax=Zizania palustris TaxID=103762 RepID=A0A8J6BWD0_ZIZPA|nr:hypothetical protein GUJ93_ZPchr0012g19642 [Zizania palustris]
MSASRRDSESRAFGPEPETGEEVSVFRGLPEGGLEDGTVMALGTRSTELDVKRRHQSGSECVICGALQSQRPRRDTELAIEKQEQIVIHSQVLIDVDAANGVVDDAMTGDLVGINRNQTTRQCAQELTTSTHPDVQRSSRPPPSNPIQLP